jgi:hypothetical protein
MSSSRAEKILEAWIDLETTLRAALPVCSVQPPKQPQELLSALRINGRIGPLEEARILALREIRNHIAHLPEEPSEKETDRFLGEVQDLKRALKKAGSHDDEGKTGAAESTC